MMRHRQVILLVACVLSNPSAWLRAAGPAPLPDFTPWDVQALEKAPAFEWLDRSGEVHSLLYEAEPYRGKKTRVFAYYASPATLGLAKGAGDRFPGMVLVHGGGGHAFRSWAELYARRGYAAIAMDLGGDIGEGKDVKRLPDGGPPPGPSHQVSPARLARQGPVDVSRGRRRDPGALADP